MCLDKILIDRPTIRLRRQLMKLTQVTLWVMPWWPFCFVLYDLVVWAIKNLHTRQCKSWNWCLALSDFFCGLVMSVVFAIVFALLISFANSNKIINPLNVSSTFLSVNIKKSFPSAPYRLKLGRCFWPKGREDWFTVLAGLKRLYWMV